MHVLFIHPNFPAQFGHIAMHLTSTLRWPCTFLTSIDTTHLQLPFNHINYRVERDKPQPKVFYNPDSLQGSRRPDGQYAPGLMDHMTAIYAGLRNAPQIKPDLVVGHMSYGTMLYLKNLYSCPFIGYFELYPPPFWGKEMILRKEFPPPEGVRLFNAMYHSFTLNHLHVVDAAYTPTEYQLNTAPAELRHKIRVIHDGIETELWKHRPIERPTEFRGLTISPDTRIVTYVSRGLESARGFDIFMKVAKRICQEMPNVVFLIAGDERTNYGHELHHIGKQSFKQWVLNQDSYDLSRIHFLGHIPGNDLVTMYCLSDLHFYLTVPYVLSWSMMQAMSTECTVLGSATAPVQEVLRDGQNGLLADFYDVDALTEQALKVLRDPAGHRPLGQAARQTILDHYDKPKCVQKMVDLFKTYEKTSEVDALFEAHFQSRAGVTP